MELTQVINRINTKYKRQLIAKGPPYQPRAIPTGLASLDLDLGGGVVLGRQFGIVGHEGSGKTTLALTIAREAQRQGMWVVWADCERSLDWNWAVQVGVYTEDNFAVMTGLTGEDAFKGIRDILVAIRSSEDTTHALIVVDSLAAMVPEDDFENTSTVAPGARLVNRAIRVWNALQTPQVGIVLINQYRSSPSSIRPVLPHGQGQLYHLSQRLDLREGSWIKEGNRVIGKEVKYSVRKSKTGQPYRSGALDLYFNRFECFDRHKSLAIAAVESGVVEQTGSWYALPSGDKVQGINGLIGALGDSDVYIDIQSLVGKMYRIEPYLLPKEDPQC